MVVGVEVEVEVEKGQKEEATGQVGIRPREGLDRETGRNNVGISGRGG